MEDGWIEWAGGDQPYKGKVQIELRNGHISSGGAWRFAWRHCDHESDIIAYRPTPADRNQGERM
jgi:hypothetical protein